MQKRLGLLLVLLPMLASGAFVLTDSAEHARPAPAPEKLEAPAPKPQPAERDEAHSQAPQHSPGEVIGVPMLA